MRFCKRTACCPVAAAALIEERNASPTPTFLPKRVGRAPPLPILKFLEFLLATMAETRYALWESLVGFSGEPMNENQRSGIRIPVELPAVVHWKSRRGHTRSVEGKTGNISGNGLFMNIPVRPPRQTSVTMRVFLPAIMTRVPIELLCNGRVIRWSCPGEVRGMGATIDEYEFRPART